MIIFKSSQFWPFIFLEVALPVAEYRHIFPYGKIWIPRPGNDLACDLCTGGKICENLHVTEFSYFFFPSKALVTQNCFFLR
jgi:hypothetical protein